MTEAEWLACEDPRAMIGCICVESLHAFFEMGKIAGALRQNKTERRFRLFACACMRQAWHVLHDQHARRAVELAELYVEGEASLSELFNVRTQIEAAARRGILGRLVRRAVRDLGVECASEVGVGVTERFARLAALKSASEALELLAAEYLYDLREPRRLLANIFRDIFGNPFRWLGVSRAWRTDTAITLARQMYESRDFSAMPILADALQDAGCESEDILTHCRGPGPHFRGCWVVDMVLRKV